MSTLSHSRFFEEAYAPIGTSVPICVDLDGTLVRGDLLVESIVQLLKINVLYLLLLPFWLLRGKAFLKQEVSRRVDLDVSLLPYNQALLSFLQNEYRSGRTIILATAADQRIANKVAEHLGIFEEVLASDGQVNLSGRAKRELLIAKFGEGGFDYAADNRVDLSVWAAARRAITVNATSRVERQARRSSEVALVLSDRSNLPRTMLKASRLHQWAKNVLIFVPLLTSHQLTDINLILRAFCAFISFSLCASSVYLLNDLLDIEADRKHPKKRKRPFASGDLEIRSGVLLCGFSLMAGFAIASTLGWQFTGILTAYYMLTLAYSFFLKRKLLLDVHCLAGLYTIRVLAGGAATGVSPSAWLLAFSMFLFLSLALVKRVSELKCMLQNNIESASGRSYGAGDFQALASLGTGSGFICVLITALYMQSPQVTALYQTPSLLLLLCPLFSYWMSRVWMIAYRGKMNHDPVVFALKDRVSYLVGALAAAVMYLATLTWPEFFPVT